MTFTCAYAAGIPRSACSSSTRRPTIPKLVFSDSWPDNVHHWFPCFDYPNDKVTNELIVTVKSGLQGRRQRPAASA